MATRPVVAYIALTFVLSWVFFIPPVLDFLDVATPIGGESYNGFANFVSTFGPLAAAIILLARSGGWTSAWALIRSGFDFRIDPRILAASVLLPVATAYATRLVVSGTGIDDLPGSMVPQNLGYPSVLWLIPAFLTMMVFGGGQEEFGWRGYAQQPMQASFGIVAASLVLGAIWGVWHLPLWILPGDPHVYIPFVVFVIFTMALSVQMAWLYQLSGFKLAVPWIMHGVQNTVLIVFPVYRLDADGMQTGLYLYVALNIAVAAAMTLMLRRS